MSKRADCESAINRPPCNQHAYLTIRVPCIYRLDGLTRRTSRDFNKRNRWGLSKRPRVRPAAGEDCGVKGEVKSTRGHTERRLETAGAAVATITFAETTSRRSSNGTVSPFESHTKESTSSSGIATTMTSTRMRGETMTGTIAKAGSCLLGENRKILLASVPPAVGFRRAASSRVSVFRAADPRRIIIPRNYSADARVRERREIKSA